jgi:hypothetical protein
MMRRVVLALMVALLPAAPAMAKKKKPSTAAQTHKTQNEKAEKPPNDKRTNEGAQGRINATEDAARDADSPQFQRRP